VSNLNLIKVWDPVTRLWHWLLAVIVTTGWVFGEFMSFDTVVWHFYLGYSVLGLLAFRLVWGFIGPAPVRWSLIFPRPTALKNYISHITKREPSGTAGHNPLGSLSVLMLLLLLLAQATTGLFIETEDFFESGPLYNLVSQSTVDTLTWLHHLISKLFLGMVILHLTAILFYRFWKHEDLIKPMITGWKWVRKDADK